MRAIQPYLFFNGNCRQAMSFYAEALRGTLNLNTAAEVPGAPPLNGDLILHARLSAGDAVLMASDWMATDPFPEGRSFSLCIECESREEQSRLFDALSRGGNVTMPLGDTFWGAHFGMLVDKFGVRWMLNLETTPSKA